MSGLDRYFLERYGSTFRHSPAPWRRLVLPHIDASRGDLLNWACGWMFRVLTIHAAAAR